MTDEQIINLWKHERELSECVCSCFVDQIELSLVNETIDLITRQKAEIERLQKIEIETDDFCRRLCRMRMLDGSLIASFEDLQNYIKKEKSEAVKEFAERLKESKKQYEGTIAGCTFTMTELDNLVKEMVGDTE